MKDIPPVVQRLKKLAQAYRDTHLELQKQHREMTSVDNFLAQLRQRDANLLDRFRQIQQQLLACLEEEKLEKMLDLSRVFDEMRVINLFTIQTLREAGSRSDPQAGQEEKASSLQEAAERKDQEPETGRESGKNSQEG
ncbi:MAG: hypothetical protein ACLFVT_08185 [Syntrophobacteria bacterium]